MFTGIVTDIGEIQTVTAHADNLSRIEIACDYDAPRSRSARRLHARASV